MSFKTITKILLLGITFSIIGCNLENKNKPQPHYQRQLVPCQVAKSFEVCCGVFPDKYLITETNRYKIHELDNIVVGDSICVYEWSDDKTKKKKFVKNKNISIYE